MNEKKEKFIKYTKIASISILIIGIALATYIVQREQFDLRKEAETGRVARFFLLPNIVEVDTADVFDITFWLDTGGQDVVGVDIILQELTLLEIVSITPHYDNFSTFVPANSDGSFDSTTAISNKGFGAVTYDWDNATDPITPPVNNAGVRLATIQFRALAEGQTTIHIQFDGESGTASTADSNVVLIEDTGDVITDILSDPNATSDGYVGVMVGTPCTPDCTGKECGDDGCGVECGDGSCDSPPDNHCLTGADADTRRTYYREGTCVSYQCDYTYNDVECPYGCLNGVCENCTGDCQGKACGEDDDCGNQCDGTCTNAPANYCVDTTTRRSFDQTGTCDTNSYQCDYNPQDKTCTYGCNTDTGTCNNCTADCIEKGKECGDNGCGGSCGTCEGDQECQNNKCIELVDGDDDDVRKVADIHSREGGKDNKVDGWDISMILASWKRPDYNPIADVYGPRDNDYEKDNYVDGNDLARVVACWGDIGN